MYRGRDREAMDQAAILVFAILPKKNWGRSKRGVGIEMEATKGFNFQFEIDIAWLLAAPFCLNWVDSVQVSERSFS